MGAYPFTDTATDAWEYGIDAYEAWIRLNALAQTRSGGPIDYYLRTTLETLKLGVRAEILLPTSTTFRTNADYVLFYVGFDMRIFDPNPRTDAIIEAGLSRSPRVDGTQDNMWHWFVNNRKQGAFFRGNSTPMSSGQLRMELGNVSDGLTSVFFYVDDVLVWFGSAPLGGLPAAWPKYVTTVFQSAGTPFTLRFDLGATWREAHYQEQAGPLRIWTPWADPATKTEVEKVGQPLRHNYIAEFTQRQDYIVYIA